MKCVRCKGFMVIDDLIDLQESYVPMWMRGWRCLSCGNVVDPLILRHRMIQHAGATRLLEPKAGVLACVGPTKARAS
jgi:hypothetical protein